MGDENTTTDAQQQTQTETATGQNAGQQAGDAKQFTQADIDRIIGERLKRAEENSQKKLLELAELAGVEKPEDLRALIDSEKKRREAEMSEAEKSKAQIDTAHKERDQLAQRIAEMEAAQRESAINTAIERAAVEAKAKIPADVIMWVRQSENIELLNGVVDKDGKSNPKAIETIIGMLQASRPGWFKTVTQSPGSPSNSGGGSTQDAKKKAAATAQFNATKRGGF